MSDEAPGAAPVLAPVDFSAHSEAALLVAADFAAMYGAPLVVLHVIYDPASEPGYYEGARGDPAQSIEQIARAAFDEWIGSVKQRHRGIPALDDARLRLVHGVPPGRILEVADDEGARMIVMGSQGRTGLPRMLMGSTAQRVAHLAQVPVTIVKAPAEVAG